MTTPEQSTYDRGSAPIGPGASSTQPVRRGPGWGAYVVTVIGLVLLIAVVVFVLQNDQRLTIKFLSWTHTYNKSSVALGAAALVGFLAGLLLGLIPWMSARRKLRNARRDLS